MYRWYFESTATITIILPANEGKKLLTYIDSNEGAMKKTVRNNEDDLWGEK